MTEDIKDLFERNKLKTTDTIESNNRYDKIETILNDILGSINHEYFESNKIAYQRKDVLKSLKIAYLTDLLEYSVWADCVPNGDAICNEYQEILKNLKK